MNKSVVPDAIKIELTKACERFRRLSDGVAKKSAGGKSRVRGGVRILLVGARGSGKALAAQWLASELNLELLRLDLSALVSKYIGETEKHLDRILGAAEPANIVLLFDEADELFGHRTEVKDAHDRYANMEAANLLQRIEAYSGIAILTTNRRDNIDVAFLRRMHCVVEF